MSPKLADTLREYAELVIFFGVLMTVTLSVGSQYNVRGPSMEPTLQQEDRVIVNRLTALSFDGLSLWGSGDFVFQGPERGDIVVFEPQNYGSDSIVKRVIGIPGDNILITRQGEAIVNGQRESFGDSFTRPKSYFDYPVMVPVGHYFVMGDNRNESSDSRDWGFLPASDIIGKAWAVVWPLERFQVY